MPGRRKVGRGLHAEKVKGSIQLILPLDTLSTLQNLPTGGTAQLEGSVQHDDRRDNLQLHISKARSTIELELRDTASNGGFAKLLQTCWQCVFTAPEETDPELAAKDIKSAPNPLPTLLSPNTRPNTRKRKRNYAALAAGTDDAQPLKKVPKSFPCPVQKADCDIKSKTSRVKKGRTAKLVSKSTTDDLKDDAHDDERDDTREDDAWEDDTKEDDHTEESSSVKSSKNRVKLNTTSVMDDAINKIGTRRSRRKRITFISTDMGTSDATSESIPSSAASRRSRRNQVKGEQLLDSDNVTPEEIASNQEQKSADPDTHSTDVQEFFADPEEPLGDPDDPEEYPVEPLGDPEVYPEEPLADSEEQLADPEELSSVLEESTRPDSPIQDHERASQSGDENPSIVQIKTEQSLDNSGVKDSLFAVELLDLKATKWNGVDRLPCHYCERDFSQTKNPQKSLEIHLLEYCLRNPCSRLGKKRVTEEVVEMENKMCHICGAQFDNNDDLKKHVIISHEKTKHHCLHCKRHFTSVDRKEQHETYFCAHNTDKIKPSRCSHCRQLFPSRQELREHVVEMHPDHKSSPGKSKLIPCDRCGMRFTKQNSLYVHKVTVHNIKEARFHCPTCNKPFHYIDAYKMHVATHSEERPHLCPTCGKAFKNRDQVMKHRRRIHENKWPYYCDKCGHGVDMKKNLLTHKCHRARRMDDGTHRPNRYPKKVPKKELKDHDIPLKPKVECSFCGLQRRNERTILRHVQMCHAEEPSYSMEAEKLKERLKMGKVHCEICKKEYKDRRYLEEHIKMVHSEVDAYIQCPECPKKFKFQSLVDRHVKNVHKSDGPHVCEQCKKVCKTRKNLLWHKKYKHELHIRKFQCDLCDFRYAFHKQYYEHVNRVHGPKKQECHICGYKCATRWYLNKHLASCSKPVKRAKSKHLVKNAPGDSEHTEIVFLKGVKLETKVEHDEDLVPLDDGQLLLDQSSDGQVLIHHVGDDKLLIDQSNATQVIIDADGQFIDQSGNNQVVIDQSGNELIIGQSEIEEVIINQLEGKPVIIDQMDSDQHGQVIIDQTGVGHEELLEQLAGSNVKIITESTQNTSRNSEHILTTTEGEQTIIQLPADWNKSVEENISVENVIRAAEAADCREVCIMSPDGTEHYIQLIYPENQ